VREVVRGLGQQLDGVAHQHMAALGALRERHRQVDGGALERPRATENLTVGDAYARGPAALSAALGHRGGGQRGRETAEHADQHAVDPLDLAVGARDGGAEGRRRAVHAHADHGRRGRQRCGASPAVHGGCAER
jgi:hypothetical protein